ncbi:WD40-repeat-containing domain protein, partial [Lasiosphaeria hispida]
AIVELTHDKTIKIWDMVMGTCMQMLMGHSHQVWSVVFLPDLKLVVSGSDNKTIKIWDVVMGICM